MLSIICPVRNESEFIEELIKFLIRVEPADKEIFFVDGDSTDGTAQIIEKYSAQFPGQVFLLHNPHKYVPFALNIAIPKCKSEYIVRMDAHSIYADDYFLAILKTFKESGADIVGGPTRANGKTNLQKAIAKAISSKFGTGGSKVHDENYRGYTNHVTFGAFKAQLFKDVGLFDTEFIRNQDDELHYRAKSKGKKIFLDPAIRLMYFPRTSFPALISQYFQYGYFKPLVSMKVSSEIKLRHLIPSVFVLYILLAVIFPLSGISFIPLIFYAFLMLRASFAGLSSIPVSLLAMAAFPLIHLSYGSGYLCGLLRLIFRRPRK